MSGDVVIGSSMRANLLSLQKTNSLMDATQFKLSTGRKVNSALDNPQSFFAAQSLNNRASDLGRLLDGMGQSLQTIKQADKGITALTKLVEQADAITQQASDAISSSSQEARIVGDKNLTGKTNLPTDLGVTADSTITFTVTDPEDASTPALNASSVTIAANDSIEQLITAINDKEDADGNHVLEAKLNESGQLEIKALNGGKVEMVFEDGGAGADDAADMRLAQALGFGGLAKTKASGAGGADPNRTAVTLGNSAALESFAMRDGNNNGAVATRSTALTDLEDSEGNALVARAAAGGSIGFSVDGGTVQTIISDLATTDTVQDLVDGINSNATLKGKIQASFDESTGQISIRAIDETVKSVEIAVTNDADSAIEVNFGFGVRNIATAASSTEVESIALGSSAGELAKLESDFNSVLTQIDQLVEDSDYRGTNLLKGNDLVTVFNEDRTTSLTTKGGSFTSVGMGIDKANFGSSTGVASTFSQLRSALSEVRSFGSTIANDLAVIQTRQDFTKETIQNLTEGADKLTVADPNEEGATMLALQTRLQLGVTSLSLASQSSQSVLRMF